jgi:hypothetical protein
MAVYIFESVKWIMGRELVEVSLHAVGVLPSWGPKGTR